MMRCCHLWKKAWMLLWCSMLLVGCASKTPDEKAYANKSSFMVPSDSYYLPGKILYTLDKGNYEEADVLYDVEDEMGLAEVIQYAYENGQTTIAYQSEKELDLNQTAAILGVLNPFDLTITENDVIYTDSTDNILYTSHQVTFCNLDERYEEALREAKRRMKHILSDDMNIEEQVKAIHDDIICHSTYDEETAVDLKEQNASFSAAGVLLDGKGVCTGYSRAFMMMARVAGIPAVYVGSEAMNHGWNFVYDGTNWYYIDVTWDDPLPDQGCQAQSTYLWKSDEVFFSDGAHLLSEQERLQRKEIIHHFF